MTDIETTSALAERTREKCRKHPKSVATAGPIADIVAARLQECLPDVTPDVLAAVLLQASKSIGAEVITALSRAGVLADKFTLLAPNVMALAGERLHRRATEEPQNEHADADAANVRGWLEGTLILSEASVRAMLAERNALAARVAELEAERSAVPSRIAVDFRNVTEEDVRKFRKAFAALDDTPEARAAAHHAAHYCPDCNCPRTSLAHATRCLAGAETSAS